MTLLMENNPYHIPVLLHVATDALIQNKNGCYVDLTFGGGGHSKEMLSKLDDGKLLAFDQDEDALKNSYADHRFNLVRQNFRHLQNVLNAYGYGSVDGVLADLGVSSFQFDTADRGFSFRFDAQLDMRMNSGASLSAYEVVNKYDEEEFLKILISYGEFRKGEAVKIFRKINEKRSQAPIKSTKDLCQTVSTLVPSRFENKFLAKLFQSIRIEVNNEMQALEELLCQLPDCVSQNGVVVFITYHSIEDRMVKNFFKSGNIEGNLSKDFYGKVIKPFEVLNKKPIVPSDDEISNNSRARSAKLRMAKRV